MKNAGVPVDAELLGFLRVRVDPLLDGGLAHVLLELRGVEPQLGRVRLELLGRQLALVLEDLVVHLPELALLARRLGRRVRRRRVGMDAQRHVLERDAHVVPG